MSDRLGIELLPDRVRAVALGRWRDVPVADAEVAWDPAHPDEAVAALSARLAHPGRIALSVGLAFLDVQRVTLPPLRAGERRAALALDPSRWFPEAGSDAVVAVARESTDGAEPAMAVDGALVSRWAESFARWAPVECIEPAPASLARALAAVRAADGAWLLPAADGERGVVSIVDGRVDAVRRAPAWGDDPIAARPLPTAHGLPADRLLAYGAALGVDAPLALQLVPSAHARAVARRRRMRVGRAAIAAVAGALLLAVAADRARDRLDAALDRELSTATARAERGAALEARVMALDAAAREADAMARRRADPLGVLAALGTLLPRDVTVLSVRAQGDTWQIDGTARDASAVVPLLDRDPRFADVRVLAPSSRFESGGATRESFSVAFRARPQTARR